MTPLGLRRKITFCFLSIFCIWAFGFLWFTQQVPNSKNELPISFDSAIIVLTGDSGRMEYGIQLLAEHKGKVLFVSGAGEKVTVDDILRQSPPETRKKINEKEIIIGNDAENTIGNAQEITLWLKQSNYKRIILVTSNYHMPRALLELSTSMPAISITPAPVIATDKELLFSEYHKYLASKLRHLFLSVTQEK